MGVFNNGKSKKMIKISIMATQTGKTFLLHGMDKALPMMEQAMHLNFTWGAGNRLIAIGTAITYAYDADSIRTFKTE